MEEGLRKMSPAQRVQRAVALTILAHRMALAQIRRQHANEDERSQRLRLAAPRATNDIDIVASLDATGARRLPGLLGTAFYADPDVAEEAVRRRASFNGRV